jgi:hypothetical protein
MAIVMAMVKTKAIAMCVRGQQQCWLREREMLVQE